MKSTTFALVAGLLLAPGVFAQVNPPQSSGIDLQQLDPAMRPQDDLYLHVNGKWLATAEIPRDRAQYGTWVKLIDDTQAQLRAIVEGIDAGREPRGSERRKIADLYASFMDEARLEALGTRPLAAELARVNAMKGKADIAAVIARFNRIGVSAPYDPEVHQDNRDSTRYVYDISQGGLGLPDRDYYLKDDDARLVGMRNKYREHIAKMLAMAGEKRAEKIADDILALETRLARVQWTKVENRDPVKRYNRVPLAELPQLAPRYDWKRYIRDAGLQGRVDNLIVSQPSYIKGLAEAIDETPLPVWKEYFRWHLLKSFAPYLSKPYADEAFAFTGTVLRGIPENRPRWKRGLQVVEQSIGEALGKVYVERHFPPETKARMDRLVRNLLQAYRQSIDALDWMGPETKKEAQAKLASFVPKIGYPARWRDYSRLRIERGDLVGNVIRANEFEHDRNVAKLGKPIDRDEWFMTPQRVNAYYNPEMNEIVFPAAILQPPFFHVTADDAINYGAIGAVIGHEASHGFDDQGSQYDGLGNLRNWWTKEDHERYAARTRALVAQYAGYSPLPGYNLNGELTLGENIADNSGLAIAYKAYRISLGGKPAPVIDGLSGDQRFFLGWAQVWREKTRDEEIIRLVKIDPHSPSHYRAIGAAVNHPAFHEAFAVKQGDRMYLPPEKRVSIW
jgi:predicted metalloendopeptidase